MNESQQEETGDSSAAEGSADQQAREHATSLAPQSWLYGERFAVAVANDADGRPAVLIIGARTAGDVALGAAVAAFARANVAGPNRVQLKSGDVVLSAMWTGDQRAELVERAAAADGGASVTTVNSPHDMGQDTASVAAGAADNSAPAQDARPSASESAPASMGRGAKEGADSALETALLRLARDIAAVASTPRRAISSTLAGSPRMKRLTRMLAGRAISSLMSRVAVPSAAAQWALEAATLTQMLNERERHGA